MQAGRRMLLILRTEEAEVPFSFSLVYYHPDSKEEEPIPGVDHQLRLGLIVSKIYHKGRKENKMSNRKLR